MPGDIAVGQCLQFSPRTSFRLRRKLKPLLRGLPSAFGSALLWPVFVLVFLPAAARAQLSPGPLSKAHQSLSGPTKCTACHKLGLGSGNLKCLECHTEISSRLAGQRGYHPQVVKKGAGDKDCARCHSEHNGESFGLIRWNPPLPNFDHALTGYVLEGKHAPLACAQCHLPDRILPSERPSIKIKDIKRTYLGLAPGCLNCHIDQHKGQLGSDCLPCHNFSDWKDISKFDHAKTKYPLTGAHANVLCGKCHVAAGPTGPVKYTGLAFGNCADCHTDPHKGAFKDSCQTCHNTAAWKTPRVASKFDHSTTNFLLLGKHAQVGCETCHGGADFKKPLQHEKCADCHHPDPHSGQFAQRADGGACEACHVVEGWKPATFGVREHAQTKYPLLGRHIEVACAKCHLPVGTATRYKITFARCLDCHTDAHKKQFAKPPYANKCESCHTVDGFHPSTYPLGKHEETRFPLTGAHMAVPCIECHKADTAGFVPYRFEDRACQICHLDPHRGEFQERMKKRRKDGSVPGCEACHVTKSWSNVSRFDHSTTAFPLLGKHRDVPCMGCHTSDKLETTLKNVNFKEAPTKCENCHEDRHAGQFVRYGTPPDCAHCHTVIRWKPSLFDHDKEAAFSLQGAHKDVACDLCHKLKQEVNGVKVLFYKPTPTKCAACHGST